MPLALILTVYIFLLGVAAWASVVAGPLGAFLLVVAALLGAAAIAALAWSVRKKRRLPHEEAPT